MKRLILYLALFLGLMLHACQATEVAEEVEQEEAVLVDSTAIQYLLYPQQGLLEMWTNSPELPSVLLDSFPLLIELDFPIGIYQLQFDKEEQVLWYPNAFYKEKLGSKAISQQLSFEPWVEKYPRLKDWEGKSEGKRVVVMAEGACFACPHWMAEVYSLLEAAQ